MKGKDLAAIKLGYNETLPNSAEEWIRNCGAANHGMTLDRAKFLIQKGIWLHKTKE